MDRLPALLASTYSSDDLEPSFAIVIGLSAFVAVVISIMVAANKSAVRARRERIYQRYGHTEVAERIIKRLIWVGQTTEQLTDSIGEPHDTDQRVLKTKTKEIWKYQHRGANRYGLRITVENGGVVGWDEKL